MGNIARLTCWVLTALAICCLWPHLSFAGPDTGCIIAYTPTSNAFGQVSSGVNLCDNDDAVCRWFGYSACGTNCQLYVCFGATQTDCLEPSITVVQSPSPPIPCGQFADVPIYCRPSAGSLPPFVVVCEMPQCGSCPNVNLQQINDWNSGNYVDVRYTCLHCNC